MGSKARPRRRRDGVVGESADLDDIRSAGMEGLEQAAQAYDPRKGRFPPLARKCIKNKMIDALRTIDDRQKAEFKAASSGEVLRAADEDDRGIRFVDTADPLVDSPFE